MSNIKCVLGNTEKFWVAAEFKCLWSAEWQNKTETCHFRKLRCFSFSVWDGLTHTRAMARSHTLISVSSSGFTSAHAVMWPLLCSRIILKRNQLVALNTMNACKHFHPGTRLTNDFIYDTNSQIWNLESWQRLNPNWTVSSDCVEFSKKQEK